jgi:3D-(3,5/4)-trihydroxycyclohexane-1,2-dione acylhydrolase (decyclizing)
LQRSVGAESFNNLLDADAAAAPTIDFAAHAAALGAIAEKVSGIAALAAALERARAATRTAVIVIDTNPAVSTAAGGQWWDVPVAEVSEQAGVQQARRAYEAQRGENEDP